MVGRRESKETGNKGGKEEGRRGCEGVCRDRQRHTNRACEKRQRRVRAKTKTAKRISEERRINERTEEKIRKGKAEWEGRRGKKVRGGRVHGRKSQERG